MLIAFAVASEPNSSCDLHVSREDTIRVTPDVGEPPELTIACEGITESEGRKCSFCQHKQ